MKNESGLTIIELLVTIFILFIISSILYSVLIGINKNSQQISSNTNLEEEANIALTTIKNFQLTKSIYVLSFDSNKKVYLIGNSSPSQPLGSTDISKLTIDDGYGSTIPSSPNMKTINTATSKSISVHIELGNGIYKFDTIIKKY
ncbi:prepilin-type N-terminal cleavage/methylation domain-containing protein [Bacillus sp. BRMEA1]|uniref:prepilin-type N-terminal cleavage/methylation domain-containing protein n=1 Tax=Neobacillus endophyticus TaxID=2738405 RepID=UPI0015666BEA|nr:prepilin-type N-terminal cleavage/methylation domain-containing protein [Neobacillus endophyticus]NRD76015.1 prepilin-type N-terminal cleavage/methylation domain-containing protein [Neobacillus endophyticus]